MYDTEILLFIIYNFYNNNIAYKRLLYWYYVFLSIWMSLYLAVLYPKHEGG
jgi:hypothetical protein